MIVARYQHNIYNRLEHIAPHYGYGNGILCYHLTDSMCQFYFYGHNINRYGRLPGAV